MLTDMDMTRPWQLGYSSACFFNCLGSYFSFPFYMFTSATVITVPIGHIFCVFQQFIHTGSNEHFK